MLNLLERALNDTIRHGDLTIVGPDGNSVRLGDGSGQPIVVRLQDRSILWHLLWRPQLALGEGYMQRRIVVEQGTVYDLLEVLLQNAERHMLPPFMNYADKFARMFKWVQQHNPVPRATRNVAHHYDIDGAIYDLFLDPDRQYSCAYFRDTTDLAEAQLAKKQHIAAKLLIERGHRVLDIGSGWGGLGLYLSRGFDAHVTGITLSAEQLSVARRRAQQEGLADRTSFHLMDYRNLEGRFDRIVSVGMFEHVGVRFYDVYFRKIADLLHDDGLALVHSIGRFDTPTITNPFIAKYIFPGGYIPAMSEVLPAIERSGLLVTDVEILRLHYADTLRAWRVRFLCRRDEAAERLGETFCRMWEFYLAASETAFRYQNLMVFQIQLAKRQHVVPLTRDYIGDRESDIIRRDRTRARGRDRQAPRRPDVAA